MTKRYLGATHSRRKRARIDRRNAVQLSAGGGAPVNTPGGLHVGNDRLLSPWIARWTAGRRLKSAAEGVRPIDDDGLFGSNASPARLFGGPARWSEGGTFENSIMPLKGRTNDVIARSGGASNVRKDATNEGMVLSEETTVKTESETRANVVDGDGEDVAIQKKEVEPPNKTASCLEPDLTTTGSGLLFGASSTPLGIFNYLLSNASFRSPFPFSDDQKSVSVKASCPYRKKYAPIVPRASRGPIMSPYPSSFSFGDHNQDGASACDRSSRTDCTEATDRYIGMSSTSSTLYRPLKPIPRRAVTTRRLWYRRIFSISSRARASTFPFPASNRTSLCNNDRSFMPSNKQNYRGRASCRNITSLQTATLKGIRSNMNTTAPPLCWKHFFAAPRGNHSASKTEQTIKLGEWKCWSCLHVNPAAAMTCDSCTALRGANYSSSKKGKNLQTKESTTNSDSVERKDNDPTDDLEVEELEFDFSSHDEEVEGVEIIRGNGAAEDDHGVTSKPTTGTADLNVGKHPESKGDVGYKSSGKRATLDCVFPEPMDVDSPNKDFK